MMYVGNMVDHDSWGWHFQTNELEPFLTDPSVKSAENFSFRSFENGSWQAKAPLWYVAVVAALLGALAWVRRFTVRTMLIGTTIVAVLLAVALRL